MTLLTVVRDVCSVVGVLLPQSVFSSINSNRTMQEMVSLANEMVQRIAYDTRDWTRLKKTHTINGDGVTTAFNLPANFKRMLLTANVWRSTNTLSPLGFVPDTDQWLNRRVREETHTVGDWTMMGGQIHIFPALAAGETAYFAYIDKNCIALAGGGYGDAFAADGDSFLIDERVLKLGMIWQWKAQKGAAYAEDMSTYGDALTSVMGRDSPAPIIIDAKPASWNARVAYPWPAPTP